MATAPAPGTQPGQRRAALAAVLALLATPVGFFGSTMGGLVWSLGPMLALVGALSQRGRTRRRVLLGIGIGLTLGTACYIGAGLIQPDGPGSCTGDGNTVVCSSASAT